MEAFSRPPPNTNTAKNEEQPESYQSLSQFDEELQQQALIAMEQEIEAWKDFENYMPPDPNFFYNNNRQFNNDPRYTNAQSPMINTELVDLVSNTGLPSTQMRQNSTYLWPTQEPNSKQTTLSAETTASVSPSLHHPSPFGSPDSMFHDSDTMDHSPSFYQQHSSPISAYQTPSETPTHSPKIDLFTAPNNFRVQQPPNKLLPIQPYTGTDKPAHQKSPSITTNAPPFVPQQKKKKAHNAIERRYRNNINDRITELKNAVPALLYARVKSSTKRSHHHHQEDDEDDEEDCEDYIDGVAIATKLNKATILRKATEYILHLKRTSDDLRLENENLQHLLSQLPGGQDILGRYRVQKTHREQEIKRQELQDQAVEKHRQRKEQANSKKRSRHDADESGTSSGSCELSTPVPIRQKLYHSPKIVIPPPPVAGTSMPNRVFMALFMAISFFSASPLSAGPTSKEQFESHNHISRTAEELGYSNSSSPTSYLGSLFPLSDGWSAFRTTVFAICLVQLMFPMLKFWFSFSFIKVKKVNKKSRTRADSRSSLNGNIASHLTPLTPGDQKCMQIYTILVKSLENEQHTYSNTILPQKHYNAFGFFYVLGKEIVRFVSRHWLGYEILYDDQNLTPQEQWVQVCKWIKLNEVECLGGNPQVTRCSMLYSCLHMLNLIELMEDDENEYVEQSRSRVYATAAMQMALVIPHHGLSEMLSRYFWRLSMYESGLEDDPLMRALIFDCHEDNGEDRMEVMLKSRAWNETLEVMNQQLEHFGKAETPGLSLSMTAPILLPVGILSTLHLLDNLQTQFGRLIISVTAKPLTTSQVESDFNETAFAQLLDITDPQDVNEKVDDYHRLAHWLAAVGGTVEALWKSDTETANKLIKTLVQKVPRSLVSREFIGGGDSRDLVGHKDRMNRLDELTKKSMIHTLVGATLLKKGTEQQRQGVQELWKAEQIKSSIKKLMTRNGSKCLQHDDQEDLESSVLALAEFVTAVTGLEAWISAWRLAPVLADAQRDAWENSMTEQVRHASLNLRRMIKRHSLDGLRTNQAIVERLSRLGAFVSSQIDEIDSACDCSEDEQYDSDDPDNNHVLMRRSEKALEILRGIS
ncbi:hypothetical protein INT47_013239 [Mucor saturninus]|uniref:BHLH domain-containing protein n=1 Tax=Mucor saturninus TaxID=64648 RepID=A0A8H7R498_9FUNG|nr:hypothetical protein INT47_013239 [Mucor saturninus]